MAAHSIKMAVSSAYVLSYFPLTNTNTLRHFHPLVVAVAVAMAVAVRVQLQLCHGAINVSLLFGRYLSELLMFAFFMAAVDSTLVLLLPSFKP